MLGTQIAFGLLSKQYSDEATTDRQWVVAAGKSVIIQVKCEMVCFGVLCFIYGFQESLNSFLIVGNRASARGNFRDRSAILLNSLSMAGRRRNLRKYGF